MREEVGRQALGGAGDDEGGLGGEGVEAGGAGGRRWFQVVQAALTLYC